MNEAVTPPVGGAAPVGRGAASYDREATAFARRYESVDFDLVHASILDLLPGGAVDVLDVGSGSGRDAAALRRRGHRVVAVEPARGLRLQASRRHAGLGIEWIDDALPTLSTLGPSRYDFVLLSGVWMHLAPVSRPESMLRIATLTRPGALLAVTTREGPDPLARDWYDDRPADLPAMAAACGFTLLRDVRERDVLGRPGVVWRSLAFTKAATSGAASNMVKASGLPRRATT